MVGFSNALQKKNKLVKKYTFDDFTRITPTDVSYNLDYVLKDTIQIPGMPCDSMMVRLKHRVEPVLENENNHLRGEEWDAMCLIDFKNPNNSFKLLYKGYYNSRYQYSYTQGGINGGSLAGYNFSGTDVSTMSTACNIVESEGGLLLNIESKIHIYSISSQYISPLLPLEIEVITA